MYAIIVRKTHVGKTARIVEKDSLSWHYPAFTYAMDCVNENMYAITTSCWLVIPDWAGLIPFSMDNHPAGLNKTEPSMDGTKIGTSLPIAGSTLHSSCTYCNTKSS